MRQLNLPPAAHLPDHGVDNGDDDNAARPRALPAPADMAYPTPDSGQPMLASERQAKDDATFSAQQRLAKRKAALARMRELWNNSQARKNRVAGEDGVGFQNRMRAEW
ncbi:MAG: hypothetical protein ABW069_18130 [Duganella sp.]